MESLLVFKYINNLYFYKLILKLKIIYQDSSPVDLSWNLLYHANYFLNLI